jgi:hypothetical protein
VNRSQQGQTAQHDPGQDGRATRRLGRPDRVAEGGGAGGRADQRFQVHEGAGDLGRDAGLAVGEQRGGCQRARQRQAGDGQQDPRAGRRDGGEGLGGGGHRQGGERGREELHGGHGDRVAAGEQAGLGHGEGGREQQGGQDKAVASDARPAAPAGGDQADPGERHRGPSPGQRLGQPAVLEGGEDGDQHRGGADEQGRVAHAGARDAGVLDQDRPAVPDRAPPEHGRAPGGADPEADGEQEHGGGQAEPGDGEPGRRQPVEGKLGQGHAGAPEQAGACERGHGGTTVQVHGPIVLEADRIFADSRQLRNNRS